MNNTNRTSDIVEHVRELLARGAADSAGEHAASVSYVGESEVYGLLDEIAKLRRALAIADGAPARNGGVVPPDDADVEGAAT